MAEEPKKNSKPKKKSLLSSLLPGGDKSNNSKTSSKTGMSTQKFLRIKGIRDGIIELESGGYQAIIMASSVNFALMSEQEQNSMLNGYQNFLNSLEFPIQIIVQSRIININNYLGKLMEAEKMQENQLLRMQIAEYREYIRSLVELANITSNHYYVVVPYTGAVGSKKGSPLDSVKNIISPAKEAKVGMDSYDKAIKEIQLRINNVEGGLRSMGIRAAKLNTQEVVELFYAIYNPDLAGTEILAELERLKIETE